MKKSIIVLSMCILVALPALTMTAAAEDTILLPGNEIDVRMVAVYDPGVQSRFDITLSNIPDGYHVTNSEYPGWCAQKNLAMYIGVSHSVRLYSSLAPLPSIFLDKSWDKINYILNHKQGIKNNIQNAIWFYTDDQDLSNDTVAQAMVNDAEANGTGYVPQVGGTVAIPIQGRTEIQLSFLELIVPPPSNIQGFVWYDTNKDGIQNGAEQGIKDITVRLYDSSDVLINDVQTNNDGIYSFVGLNPGEYYLQFIKKTGYVFTQRDVGNDTLDSDADTSTGKTIVFNLSTDESITIWDAGMYPQSSGGTPPEEEPVPNRAPTADATAGEPYGGVINQAITFNGTKSGDFDGRIITWRWNFGDGTNGTGEIATHNYTVPGNYTVSLLVTDNDFATNMYTTYALITSGNNPPETPVIAGPLSGHIATSYQYTLVSIDTDGENLTYFIDWGDNTNSTSESIRSGLSVELSHQWNAPGFYFVQAYSQDPDKNASGIYQITVTIDVKYVQNLGYLIDSNGDGTYDRFHSNETGVETTVNHQTNGAYLIDTDGDGKWNIEYDPKSGQTQDYREQPILQYALIVLVALIIAFLLLFFILRGRRQSRTIRKNQDSEEKNR